MKPLQVGLFDFAEPTLLVLGDSQSLEWLAEQISERKDVKLGEEDDCGSKACTRLHFVPTPSAGSLRRHADEFAWAVSSAEAHRLTEQLRQLAASTSAAHAYLDPELNVAAVQVVASKGEYDMQEMLRR